MKTYVRQTAFLLISGLLFSSQPALALNSSSSKNIPTEARAVLSPTKGNTATGTVTFMQVKGGVKIVADITGLTPGEHGFHIHEWGDCSAPDASSAGEHFNPSQKRHGAPDKHAHHAGDLGNLVADANGKAHYEFVDNQISLMSVNSILGHSVIVHEKRDDLRSQPAGNSGSKVACGIVGVVKP